MFLKLVSTISVKIYKDAFRKSQLVVRRIEYILINVVFAVSRYFLFIRNVSDEFRRPDDRDGRLFDEDGRLCDEDGRLCDGIPEPMEWGKCTFMRKAKKTVAIPSFEVWKTLLL